MTGPHADDRTGCATPLESAVLMDYWLAALPAADEEAVEAHLMSCDGCGDRLRQVIALSVGLRALARSGSLHVVVSDRFVGHAAETGLRVRDTRQPMERRSSAPWRPTTTCSWRGCCRLERRTAGRSQLVRSPRRRASADGRYSGARRGRRCHLPAVDRVGEASPTMSMIARLLAVDETGAERVLGGHVSSHADDSRSAGLRIPLRPSFEASYLIAGC